MNKQKFKKEEEIVFGLRPVIEAIEAQLYIDKIWLNPQKKSPLFTEIFQLSKEYAIPTVRVPAEKLNQITRSNHQGCIAFISPIPFQQVEDVVTHCFENGQDPLLVYLDKISDVRNFGAICRSAEAAGAHAIVVPHKGAAQISGDAVKTSSGALMNIPVCKVNSLWQSLKALKSMGIRSVGLSEKATTNLFKADLKGPLAIVLGSEEKGLSDEVQNQVDELLRIPIIGETASLNVSVAAGIAFFQAVNQRI